MKNSSNRRRGGEGGEGRLNLKLSIMVASPNLVSIENISPEGRCRAACSFLNFPLHNTNYQAQ